MALESTSLQKTALCVDTRQRARTQGHKANVMAMAYTEMEMRVPASHAQKLTQGFEIEVAPPHLRPDLDMVKGT